MILRGLFAKEKLWLKLFVFGFFSIFGLVAGAVIAHFIFPAQDSVDAMRWMQFIVSLSAFAVPALLSGFLCEPKLGDFLGISKFPTTKFILLAVVCMICLLPFVNLLASWNEQMKLPASMSALEAAIRNMEQMAEALTERLLAQQTVSDLFANLFFLAILPAITEELFFRGTLQSLLEKSLGRHWAVWIAAFVFSFYHMQFFGFFPRLLLGALLGYLFVWSKSLYLPMIAHFVNNGSLVVFTFLMKNKYSSIDIEKLGLENQYWLSIISALITFALIFLMIKTQKPESVDLRNDIEII